MKALVISALMLFHIQAFAVPAQATLLKVFFSIVQIHVEDKNGEHGAGSGVVVAPDLVATDCHVIANARGVIASQGEENFKPVALKADWRHDLCLLKFDGLPLKPVTLGNSSNLKYEQPVFSLGHSSGSPSPLNSIGYVKALYYMDHSNIIRISARFTLGASGSALFDDEGKLLGINTFKSPGRNGYFYAMPVEWVENLISAPDISITTPPESPFWDKSEEQRPYFMRVVGPQQAEQWQILHDIAHNWCQDEPASAEAWYYLGFAASHLGNTADAAKYLQKTITLNPQHTSALFELGVIAARNGDKQETQRINLALNAINTEIAAEFRQAAGCSSEC